MDNRAPIFTGTVLAALLLVASSAVGWKQTIGQGNKGIRWTGSCYHYSINEKGSDDLTLEDLQTIARDSFSTWEDVPCSYFRFVETAPTAVDRVEFNLDKGNVNLLVWREKASDWAYDERAVGMTTTQYDLSTGDILDVDMEFNGVSFNFGTVIPGTSDPVLVDLQSAITHEIGHTLGFEDLYGSADRDSTMYAYDAPGETKKRTLTQDDIDGLCTLYPEDDDPDVCEPPYCGLDLKGTSSTCNQDGQGQKDGGSDDGAVSSGGGCQTAAATYSGSSPFWRLLLRLF